LHVLVRVMGGAMGGQTAGRITFRNEGDRSCIVHGYPTIELIGAEGAVLTSPESHARPDFSPTRPKPSTWPWVVLRPRGTAVSFVVSSNWCGREPAAWRVELPASGSFTIEHGWQMGVCEFRSDPSGLSVVPIESPDTDHTKWPFVPMILTSPLDAMAGTPMRYLLFLMNVPDQPPPKSATELGSYSFPSTCPPYVERVVQRHRVVAEESHVLNCRVVGLVPGDTAVAFAMQIVIPLGLHGQAQLSWVLDPPYGFTRTVPVVIQP